jgi:hypothetical protein
VRPLCRELYQLAFLFPEFAEDVDISKYLSFYQLKRVPGGFHLSRHGLTGLLTNVAYIGYWVHQGEVVKKGNHEPIVDEELFWYAFNRLSPYTITGERNEKKNGYTRYTRKEPIPALLKYAISSREGGRVYVTTSGLTDQPIYVIEERGQDLVLKYHAATPCKEIDTLFANRLVEHLKQTTRFEHYHEYGEQLVQERHQLIKSIDDQLAEIDKQMDGIVDSLSLPRIKKAKEDEKQTRTLKQKLAERYAKLEEQKEELEKKRATLLKDETPQKLMAYYTLADRIAEDWENIPFADRQALANGLVKGVYLDEMTAHWLRLEVEWLDPQWGTERTYIFRCKSAHKEWTEAENDNIKTLYPDAPREELLQTLPRRTWAGIIIQARKLGVQRHNLKSFCDIPQTLSLEDIAFMKEAGIAVDETSCHKWESVDPPRSSA